LDIVPYESFTRHELPALLGTPLVDKHIEEKPANIQQAMYSLVAPDGSLMEGCAGVAVHQMSVGGFGHKILSPAGVLTAELSALFTTAQRHISEVIRPAERCLILTDSLSSIKPILFFQM
jgi:hypothetical protein